MTGLLLVLASIALLDSTSLIPFSVVPMAVMLGGKRPAPTVMGFLAGILVVYMAAGVLLSFGLDALFDSLSAWVTRLYSSPYTWELLLQIAIGVAMIAFGRKLALKRSTATERSAPEAVTPRQAFTFGAGLMLVGLPGALPYFGAVDQILRADLSSARSVLALLFYNLVFLAPFAALLIVRLVLPGRSESIFQRVASIAERWGRRFAIVVLLGLGIALVADGIGYLFGCPLLPTG